MVKRAVFVLFEARCVTSCFSWGCLAINWFIWQPDNRGIPAEKHVVGSRFPPWLLSACLSITPVRTFLPGVYLKYRCRGSLLRYLSPTFVSKRR
ncbi:hypothetical protein BDP55DRAFT_668357 [Colletotrichum godetiae]|uniref:Uncharacterized protein n=1 Tax=Colletotrichum godetiae TaxID=1209918 RepID=A0AAJ0ESH1_9PEZI|nr:uncharacterized protein BDP55DRAFT_668357 [Colletotrichum godetiae]KAK1673852.1 hypothetical protein BDP55DRAFT_668357 [Colletotrichum godetiae]